MSNPEKNVKSALSTPTSWPYSLFNVVKDTLATFLIEKGLDTRAIFFINVKFNGLLIRNINDGYSFVLLNAVLI